MLVSSVLEKCIKTLFFHAGVATLEVNFEAVKHIRIQQIMFLKCENSIVIEIMKFDGFVLNITIL